MKLINKLLPIVAMGSIASCVIPTVTSCGGHKNTEYTYVWEKTNKDAKPDQYSERYGEGKQINYSTIMEDYVNAAGDKVLEWLAIDIANIINKFSLHDSTASLNMKISKFDMDTRRMSVSYDLSGKGPSGEKFEANVQWENVPFDVCPMGGEYGIMLAPAGFAYGASTYIFQFNDWNIHYYTKNEGSEPFDIKISSKSKKDEISYWVEMFDGVAGYLFFGSLSYFEGAII